MSEHVDSRIVQMEFDDAQFREGVSQTIKSIKELDKSLELENGAESINNVTKALKNVDTSGMEKGLDQVSLKFSVMQAAAFTAVSNITNRLMGMAENVARSVTIQPLLDGLDEYRLKLDSIKTIQTNTAKYGTTMEEITSTLDELNKYADQTIYKFSDMTTNIGKFTAAGVGLQESAIAIKGISNLAAASGASANDASRAMYNLSQALSVGSLKLIDWNSVVNANMGGQLFQNALIRTARTMGIAVDEAIEQNGSFRESLKEDWITSEVLIRTLEGFTMATEGATEAQIEANRAKLEGIGFSQEAIDEIFKEANAAQAAATKVKTFQQLIDTTQEALGSGWATTWELIIGNLEEAENFWTTISEGINGFIDAMSDARNNLLRSWRDSGARTEFIDHILQGFQQLMAILGKVQEVTDKIFTNNIGKYADGLSTYFHRWGQMFGSLEPLMSTVFSRIETITKPVTSAFFKITAAVRNFADIVISVVNPIIQAFDDVFGDTITRGFRIFSQTIGTIRTTLRSLRPSVSTIDVLRKTFTGFFESIKPGVEIGMWLFNVLRLLGGIGIKGLAIAFEGITQALSAFMDALSPIGEVVGELLDVVFGGASDAGNEVVKSLKDTNHFLNHFINFIKKGIPGLKDLFNPLKEWAKDVAKAIRESGLLDWLKDNIPKAIESVKKGFEDLGPALQGLMELMGPIANAVVGTVIGGLQALEDVVSKSGIGDFIAGLGSKVSDLIGISQAFADTGENAESSASGFEKFASNLGSALGSAGNWALSSGQKVIEFLGAMATLVWNTVSPAIDWLGQLFTQLWQIVQNVAANFDFGPAFNDFLNTAQEKGAEFFKMFEEGSPNLIDFFEFLGSIVGDFGTMFLDVLPRFGEFMGAIGGEVANATNGPLADLGNFIESLKVNLESIPGIITAIPGTIGSTIAGVFSGLTGFIKNPFAVEKAWADTGEGGGSGISAITDQVNQFENEAFVLSKALNTISGYLKSPMATAKKTVKETFVGGMNGIAEGLNEGLGAIDFNNITMFIENCKNVVVAGSALWGTISLISVFESIREIFLSVANWTKGITDVITSVKGVFDSIAGVFKSVSKGIENISDAVTKSIRANNFLKYAIGTIAMLGAVAAAIIVLGRQDPEQLKRGGIAAGAIMGALVVYSALMMLVSRIDSAGQGSVKTLAGLTGMGMALLMVARSIEKLGKLKEEELLQGSITVGIMIFLLGMMASMVGVASSEGLKGAALLLAFGLVLRTLVATLTLYALMPWGDYQNGLNKLVGVLTVLWAVMMGVALAGRISKESLGKAAAAMMALSAALVVIAGVMVVMNLITSGKSAGEVALMALPLVLTLAAMAGALTMLGKWGGTGLTKAAAAMTIMSVCLGAISGVLTVLSLIFRYNPEGIIASAVVIIGMLFVVVEALRLLGNKTRQLKTATEAIWSMTIALGAITAALAILTFVASYNFAAFITSAVALGVLMLTMAGTLMLIGRYGAKIDAAIPAIWNMALAIAAIGGAISAMLLFSGGDVAAIAVSGIALAGILIVLAAAIAILSKEGLKADMAATAMLGMAGALGVMALSIALLGSLPIPAIVQGFIGLVAATALLGVAAVAITALSEVMVPAGAVLLLLGAGLLSVAAAFYVFVAALSELAQVAPEAFQSIIDSKDQMVGAFAAMGEAIAAAIMSFFSTLIGGVGQGLNDMAATIDGHAGQIGTAAISIGKALVEGVIVGLGGMAIGVGAAIIEGIGGAIESANQTVVQNGGALSEEMAAAMRDHPEIYGQAGLDSAEQYAQGVDESTAPKDAGAKMAEQTQEAAVEAAEKQDSGEMFDAMLGNIDVPPEIKDRLVSSFGEMFDQDTFSKLGGSVGNVIPSGIMTGASQNPIDVGSMMAGMNLTTASFEPDAKSTGVGIGNAVNSGAAETMADTSPVQAAIDAQLGAIDARSGDYLSRGSTSGNQYGQGVSTGIAEVDISPAIVANTSKMAAALEPARTAGTSVGNAFGTGEGSGISQMSWIVQTAARGITNDARNAPNGWDAGYHPGYWFGQGLADGIDSRSGVVADAAIRLVQRALEEADKTARNGSPSKLMIQKGQWYGEGYAIGMEMTGDLVARAARNITTMALDEAKTSFGVMDAFLDAIDWDAEPTITPILDTSQYEAAFGSMSTFDTSPQIQSAGWADRIYSKTADSGNTEIQNGGNHIEVHLNWEAGQTPNQAAQIIANELDMYLATKG